jgi:hypothetical protein
MRAYLIGSVSNASKRIPRELICAAKHVTRIPHATLVVIVVLGSLLSGPVASGAYAQPGCGRPEHSPGGHHRAEAKQIRQWRELAFGPDGYLCLSIGDDQASERAQIWGP